MWSIRVIIPIKLRNKVLDELHVGHIGIVKMKELSRSFFSGDLSWIVTLNS